jgi:hypothetical protein
MRAVGRPEGEQNRLLPERLYFRLGDEGESRALSLVVNAIDMFASQSSRQEDLESLYETSLRILYATDACLKWVCTGRTGVARGAMSISTRPCRAH